MKDKHGMIFGERLRKKRESKNLTQTELASILGYKNYTTVSKWESGDSLPRGKELKKLVEIFNVSADYLLGLQTGDQSDITTIYNKLEPKRQKKVYNFAEAQLHAQNNKVVNLFDHKETVEVTAKVSAGTGITWLGDSTYDKEVTSKPKHYDEAFEINGDSMTPLFKDGEVIFVEHTEIVENGQIAVVQIDDESFIKKVYIEENAMRLVSLNKDYKDIVAGDDCDIRIVGKVIM